MIWETGKVERKFVRGGLVREVVEQQVDDVTTAIRPWTCEREG